MTDHITLPRSVVEQAIQDMEKARAHFGFKRLGESRLEDSTCRANLEDGASALRAALAAPQAGVSEDVQIFAIQVEKLLCEKLGRKWAASGMSIETLVDDLANRMQPQPVPPGHKLVPVEQPSHFCPALRYRLVRGVHVFVSDEMPGLLVAHPDLETAVNDLSRSINTLSSLNNTAPDLRPDAPESHPAPVEKPADHQLEHLVPLPAPEGTTWETDQNGHANLVSTGQFTADQMREYGAHVAERCARAGDEQRLEPIEGDKLPPVGSRVFILHGRDDQAHACTVTGYYAWGDLAGNKRLHRVFVRLVYEGTDREQARMLCDCYPTADAAHVALAAPDGEPETHDAICPALDGGHCNCSESPVNVDKAWARFCGAIGRGKDAPYPGMIEAFEAHYGQSFFDKDWRSETGVWAAAWKAAHIVQKLKGGA